ncbi:MAG: helix-turn-helix transcriptional regulator [Prolixibacteraceae bacterium]|nr:helix-turn-helix transcriptional regulator [Prolixibacteraceae bacterium]
METIGDKIKRLRKANGYSLMDLANMLDISDTAISKIETGKTKSITIDLGKGIAKALDVSFNELFEIESSKVSENEKDYLMAIVFLALEKYETEQIFFNDFNDEDPDEIKKFDELRLNLKKFKKGMYRELVNVGFCTIQDVKEYWSFIHHKSSQFKSLVDYQMTISTFTTENSSNDNVSFEENDEILKTSKTDTGKI